MDCVQPCCRTTPIGFSTTLSSSLLVKAYQGILDSGKPTATLNLSSRRGLKVESRQQGWLQESGSRAAAFQRWQPKNIEILREDSVAALQEILL